MLVLHDLSPVSPVSLSAAQELDEVLRTRFALPEFRPGQREAIEGLLGEPGKVLLVAPTGGGKSLTYQLPATMLEGLTLVISPLVALMEDQVRGLHARGIPATFLASNVDAYERRVRETSAREGEYKLLYCAPERLASEAFVSFLLECRLSLVAIDEAHCISQWGHDFRPDYLRIGAFLRRAQPKRVLACTATATPRVRDEIRERLGFSNALELVRGFARPNLHLESRAVEGPREARTVVESALSKYLGADKRHPSGAAIVYCATRKSTEMVANELAKKKWNVAAYHAGMDGDVRAEVNARFASGDLDIVCATNAFGMGIDRADVRLVVHAQPPASLEAYYQEVGRAGRDGDEAHGLLLCSQSDVAVRRRLSEWGTDGPASPESAARAWGLFRELLRYMDTGTCRHDFILRYFGDEREVLGGCGHCDVCAVLDETEGEAEEARDEQAIEVRKALAGVARAQRRGGIVAIAEMLRGDRTAKVERFGFDSLSTFGILKDKTQTWIVSLLRALLAAGWIDLSANEHPVPFLTESGGKVMRGDGPIRIRMPSEEKKRERVRKSRSQEAPASADASLFEALRSHRADIARGKKVPAYVVAADATLLEIARLRPKNDRELLAVKGMGPYRVEAYGDGLLAVVRRHGEPSRDEV